MIESTTLRARSDQESFVGHIERRTISHVLEAKNNAVFSDVDFGRNTRHLGTHEHCRFQCQVNTMCWHMLALNHRRETNSSCDESNLLESVPNKKGKKSGKQISFQMPWIICLSEIVDHMHFRSLQYTV